MKATFSLVAITPPIPCPLLVLGGEAMRDSADAMPGILLGAAGAIIGWFVVLRFLLG
jgi:hypothetical protein